MKTDEAAVRVAQITIAYLAELEQLDVIQSTIREIVTAALDMETMLNELGLGDKTLADCRPALVAAIKRLEREESGA
jgi:hypothetical protein